MADTDKVAVAEEEVAPRLPQSILNIINADIQEHGRLAAWKWHTRYMRYTIEKYLIIKSDSGKVIPLVLNNIQRRLLAEIVWTMFIQQKPVRMICMKSRRMGISTLISAIIFVLCRFQRNKTAFIMTNENNLGRKILSWHKLFDERMMMGMKQSHPLYLPRKLSQQSAMTWQDYDPQTKTFLKEGGSGIWVVSGKSSKGAVGDGFQYAHYSEVGDDSVNWNSQTDDNDIMVPNTPFTLNIKEGTTYLDDKSATTTGIYLQHAWSHADEWGYAKHFDGWWEFENYRVPLDPGEEIKPYGVTPDVRKQDQEDIDKVRELAWQKWKIAEADEPRKSKLIQQLNEALKWRQTVGLPVMAKGNLDQFHSQYPAFPEQAFVSKAQQYFNGVEINSRITKAAELPPPRVEGERISIYVEPKPNTRYLITADPASGKGDDFEAALVFNIDKLSIDATWHGKASIAEQAQEWADLGFRYAHKQVDPITERLISAEPALVAIEANTYGIEILRIMRESLKYPNIWRRRVKDGRTKTKLEYGFATWGNAVDSMREAALLQMRTQWHTWHIPSVEVLRQMNNFGWGKGGKPQALVGGDEYISCMWIAAWVFHVNNWVKESEWGDVWVEQKPDADPESLQDLLNDLQRERTKILSKRYDDPEYGLSLLSQVEARITEVQRAIVKENHRIEPWRRRRLSGSSGSDWRLRGMSFNRRIA